MCILRTIVTLQRVIGAQYAHLPAQPKTSRINMRLPQALMQALKARAAEPNISYNA